MKRFIAIMLIAGILSTTALNAFAEEVHKLTIYVLGESTAQTYKQSTDFPQYGWGQVLGDYFTDDVIIENRAVGGMSTKRYDNSGRLDKVLEELKPGDYLFIQFGINDDARNVPEKYTPVDEYKRLLRDRYISESLKRGAIPVLMTPSAGAVWDEKNNKFSYTRLQYGAATRELAAELCCKFIDINQIMTEKYNTMDKAEVLSGFLICEPLESMKNIAGKVDRTHFKEKGARLVAQLIAGAIPECVPELAMYLKGDEVFTDISEHPYEEDIKIAQANQLIRGDGSGIFDPDAEVTRAEFLKMAMDSAGILGHGYRAGECLDALKNDWYCHYLQGALDRGLIPLEMTSNSVEPTVKVVAEATEKREAEMVNIMSYKCGFRGNTLITQEEMAVIAMSCLRSAALSLNKTIVPVTDDSGLVDKGISPAYVNDVKSAYSYGIINETEGSTFTPKNTLTRGQAVAVMNRIAEKLR